MKAFTKRKINRGHWARRLSDTLFSPSDTDLKWICQSNSIRNNPVIPEDVDIAYNFWGKNVKALVGKGTKQPVKHEDDHKFKIPRELKKLKKSVLIVMDIFFVNEIPFFFHSAERFTLQEWVTYLAGPRNRSSRLSKNCSDYTSATDFGS